MSVFIERDIPCDGGCGVTGRGIALVLGWYHVSVWPPGWERGNSSMQPSLNFCSLPCFKTWAEDVL